MFPTLEMKPSDLTMGYAFSNLDARGAKRASIFPRGEIPHRRARMLSCEHLATEDRHFSAGSIRQKLTQFQKTVCCDKAASACIPCGLVDVRVFANREHAALGMGKPI